MTKCIRGAAAFIIIVSSAGGWTEAIDGSKVNMKNTSPTHLLSAKSFIKMNPIFILNLIDCTSSMVKDKCTENNSRYMYLNI